MGGYGAVLVLLLAGWAALNPAFMPWLYIAAVLGFEAWLLLRIRRLGRDPVPAGEPPYAFDEEEAAIVGRYRFYFTFPEIARNASSALSAVGLTALALAPWLLYKVQLLPAAIIGLNLLIVTRLTRIVAPLLAQRMKAAKGDRAALRMLELHEPLWAKIHAANRR
jgi:hypothetical protein